MKRVEPFILFSSGGTRPPERTTSPPWPVAIRGGVSFCASCSDSLPPHVRCTTMPVDEIRSLSLDELLAASMCPLDVSDEVLRRRSQAIYTNGGIPPTTPRRRLRWPWHKEGLTT